MSATPAINRRRLLDALPDVALELDENNRVVDVAGPRDGAGLLIEPVLGRPFADVVAPPAAKAILDAVERARRLGRAQEIVECRVPVPGGERWCEARVVPLAGGGVAAFIRDTTGRKHVEAELEESEHRFRIMADSAPVLLWLAGTSSDCEFFNKPWLEFTGRPIEKELGAGWAEGVHPEDFQHCMHVYTSSFVARRDFRMEYRLRRADGAYRWILDTGVPRFSTDGSFAGYVGSCIDVTELKELQMALDLKVRARTAELHAALAERETLIHEAHHRVKNNLQVISSLLSLQARNLSDREPRDALAESQGRVFSIALVHERLYRSKDLAQIDFEEYVRTLADNVMYTFGPRARGIGLTVEVAQTKLAVDEAIPCGLIINELLTNALKYAFPNDRGGTIKVALSSTGKDAVLEVRDDGIGLPDSLDVKKTSTLGLSLVSTLTSQLGGALEIERTNGTAFRVKFEIGAAS